MPLDQLQGYSKVKEKIGDCSFTDFKDIGYFEIDTYFDEELEFHQKSIRLILREKEE